MPPCLLSLSAPHLASRPCFAMQAMPHSTMQAMPHSGPHLRAPCCPYLHPTSPCPHRCVLTTGSNAYLCSPLLLSCILATPCPCSHAVPSIDTAVAPSSPHAFWQPAFLFIRAPMLHPQPSVSQVHLVPIAPRHSPSLCPIICTCHLASCCVLLPSPSSHTHTLCPHHTTPYLAHSLRPGCISPSSSAMLLSSTLVVSLPSMCCSLFIPACGSSAYPPFIMDPRSGDHTPVPSFVRLCPVNSFSGILLISPVFHLSRLHP